VITEDEAWDDNSLVFLQALPDMNSLRAEKPSLP
jgi:hypothetical protein